MPLEDLVISWVQRHDVDNDLVALLLAIAGLAADYSVAHRRAQRAAEAHARELEIQGQRLRVLKATMRTVHDIVNNSLNSLQLLRVEAGGLVPPASLATFGRVILETAAKLQSLGDLEVIQEIGMAAGTSIDFTQK